MDIKKEPILVDDGCEGVKTVNIELPSNSHTKGVKTTATPVKQVEQIVKGKVITKKKSVFKKICETFLGDNLHDVMTYVLYDVVIPASKNTISDMVNGGIDMMLFPDDKGNRRANRTRRDKGKSYVSYSSFYDKGASEYTKRSSESRHRAFHIFDDLILETRGEAEEVLSALVDLTQDYDCASVADLYDLVGITSNFTDNKYGWTSLSNATVSRVKNGYLIDLPKPEVLD